MHLHSKEQATKMRSMIDRWSSGEEKSSKSLERCDEIGGSTRCEGMRDNINQEWHAEKRLRIEHAEGPQNSTHGSTSPDWRYPGSSSSLGNYTQEGSEDA